MTVRNSVVIAGVVLAVALLSGCATAANPVPAEKRARVERDGTEPFTVTDIELPYRSVFKAQKVGNAIYATVLRAGQDKGASVIRYDMGSSRIETLTSLPDPDLIGWLVVNDDWMVWTVGSTISARSLSTGDEKVVSSTRELMSPDLNGKLAAWDGLDEQRRHQIVLHDLASGDTTVLATLETADFYNNFPAWEGDKLVWTDVKDKVGHYYVYDAKTSRTVDYPLSNIRYHIPGYAKSSGDRIYSINFDRRDEWDWTIQQFGYYSVAEKRFVPVVPDGTIINFFQVGDGLVATVDHEGQLTVRPSNESEGSEAEYHPVDGPVDFVDRSADGTLLALRSSADTTLLHVISAK